MKKLKEYNYYDDKIEYSPLYLFFQKTGRFILRAGKFIAIKIALGLKALFLAIKSAAESRSASGKSGGEKKPAPQKITELFGKIRRRLSKIDISETLLKGAALAMFVVFLGSFIVGFGVKIDGMYKNEKQFSKDAGAVCTKIMSKYGVGKTEKITDAEGNELNLYRITGLAYVRQMDFDGDKTPELLVCYEDGGIYYIEIWGYEKKELVRIETFTANSISGDESLGSWIALRRSGAKCSVVKCLGDENSAAEIYSLSKGKFKMTDTCTFDAETERYSMDGEDISTDFETIRLSYLLPIRAQKTVEAAAAHLDEFDTMSIDEIENAKTDDEKRADAYYEIIEKYNQKYGKAQAKSQDGLNYIDGLAVVRQLDFNNDGNKELMLVYRYGKKFAAEDKKGDMVLGEAPAYYMEIYSWNGRDAKLIYENDGLSSFRDGKDDEVFYILKQDGKVINICNNSYTESESTKRVWKGASKISAMNEDGRFEPIFTATVNSNYDYLTYTINGEKANKKKFEAEGYAVPYFCSEDPFDNSQFAVTVLQSRGKKLSNIAGDTVSEIKNIKDTYHE